MSKTKLSGLYQSIGLPRLIITGFVVVLCLLLPVLGLQSDMLFSQSLTRIFMNLILVLAMVPSITSGIGMNYGLPLGIVCGLLGGALSLEMRMTGLAGFLTAIFISLPLAALFGIGYGILLNKVRGSEGMIATYVGFSVVAFMDIVWLVSPFKNDAITFPMGSGLRNIVSVEGSYEKILDNFLKIRITKNIEIPIGLILFSLLFCLFMWIFLRTRLGIKMKIGGANPTYARAIGIKVDKTRILGMVISTCLGAVGIIVYAQSYGFYQFYNAPLMMAFSCAAAILIGGATVRRATVTHVIFGTVLFQTMLTIALPIANEVMPEGNLSEIIRIIISNGVILYALTKAGDK